MSSLLAITSVNKSFAKKPVLSDISFTINKGEIFGLIGLNGAGKTTLIKIILGLLKPDGGEISLFGKPATQQEARRNLVFLPEKFVPSIYLKGKEFLRLTLEYYQKKYDAKQARELIAALGMDPAALDQKMTKYSKGMGQKVGLASAFLTGCPLLILDEPMSGLDPMARIALKKVLLDCAQQGHTIFFSSHILSDIDEICDRIAVLHDHRIIFEGTTGEFKTKLKEKHLETAFLKAIS